MTKTVYLAFLDCIGDRLLRVKGDHIWVVADPGDIGDFESRYAGSWRVTGQSAGDLARRLSHFFDAALESYNKVVVVGSDHPDIPEQHLTAAIESLDHHEVVLNPTSDGGYCLVGMKRPHPKMFENIDWSTESVLKQTVGNLERRGISYELLPGWFDVDYPRDLVALHQRIKNSEDAALCTLSTVVTEALENSNYES